MKKAPIIIYILLCTVFLLGMNPGAGGRIERPGAWKELGPQGGNIRGIARNPKSPSELYAVTYSGMVFRSVNNGGSWTRKAAVNDYFYDVAIDPSNPSTIYVLAGNALYKSTDKGGSFTKISLGNYCSAYEGAIAIHPSNPKIIMISGSFTYNTASWDECLAVFKTANGGQSWTVTKFDTTSTWAYGYDVVISPKKPTLVYLCGVSYTNSGCTARVFQSINGGKTWKNVTPDFINPYTYNYVYAVAADPTVADRAFIVHSYGVTRTSNSGTTWENQTSPTWMYAYAITIDKAAPDTLYAGGHKTLYESTDGGQNWTTLSNGLYGTASKTLVQGQTLHFASDAGIFKSTDGGETFAPGYKGVLAAEISGFVLHRAASSALGAGAKTLYAAAGGYGIFKSTNDGGAWTKLANFAGSDDLACLVSPRADPRRIYVSTYG